MIIRDELHIYSRKNEPPQYLDATGEWREASKAHVLFAIKQQATLLNSAVEKMKRLQSMYLVAKKFDPEKHTCPECESSDYPGRHYNNNDRSSGQYLDCQTCNPEGER